ncbi:MAG: glycosyltransferase [Desulfobacteraceae bacterium]|nr:MAG: glycosyltransferase [Desulfobacteraceae bacterium]
MKSSPAKKILHIVEDLKVGGLEKILASIVLSLDPSKYAPQVWCLTMGGQVADELIKQGISVRILGLNGYYNPLRIAALARMMKKEKFHIIHTHGYFAGTFGRLAAILAGVPVIIAHVHSTYYDYGKRNLLIERFLSCFTDRIICISQAVERFVTVNEKIRKEKTCLIYNGVTPPDKLLDDNLRKKLRASLGLDADVIVIAVVASLTANKGHGLLLTAFKEIFLRHPSVRLLIIGDGPLREQIEASTRQLMIDRVVLFMGIRKDVFDLLQIADIFVLPTQIREGLGVALIEAMAVGLPIIATSIGGIPEVIEDAGNGFLVSPGSSKQLAEAIRVLVNDQALRTDMGLRGRQIYESKFTMLKMTGLVETMYDELLCKRLDKKLYVR